MPYEAQLTDIDRANTSLGLPTQPAYPLSVTRPAALPLIAPAPPLPPTTEAIHHPVKRWTVDKLQQQRLEGLCFKCDETFVRGQKCKGHASLMYLESTEENHGLNEHFSSSPFW